jgi:hypothetical protein
MRLRRSTHRSNRESGPPFVFLRTLEDGDYHVSPLIAERLANALDQWGKACLNAARRVRAAARRIPNPRKGRH